MKMTYFIGSIIVSLTTFAVSYITICDLTYSLAISITFLLYLCSVGFIKWNRYDQKKKKIHEEFRFINSFIITLSVKTSIDSAFDTASTDTTGELKDIVARIDTNDSYSKTKYLENYFETSTYKLFLNVVSNYLENGGDVLSMSKLLVDELTRIENFQVQYDTTATSKLVEFIILWVLSYLILGFMRYALRDYYYSMISTPIYKFGLVIFFGFVLISIHLMLTTYTGFLEKQER